MVLGKVNKSLVQLVEQLGVRAIGISGKDGGLLKVDKKLADGEDIGFVGDVKEVNADIIYDLLEKRFPSDYCTGSVWMMNTILITLMRMIRYVQSRKRSMQRNLHS